MPLSYLQTTDIICAPVSLPNKPNSIAPSPVLTTAPPPLPSDALYTSCYCEENVYLLAKSFQQIVEQDKEAFLWDMYVVFISNRSKTVQ